MFDARDWFNFECYKGRGKGNCGFEITLKCRIIIYLQFEINFFYVKIVLVLCALHSIQLLTYLLYISLLPRKKPFNLVSFLLSSCFLSFSFFLSINARYKNMCRGRYTIRRKGWDKIMKHKKNAFSRWIFVLRVSFSFH